VRAKTRRQTITSDGTPGLLCLSNPDRRQTAIFSFQGGFNDKRSLTEGYFGSFFFPQRTAAGYWRCLAHENWLGSEPPRFDI
jgi:hypothetical protein